MDVPSVSMTPVFEAPPSFELGEPALTQMSRPASDGAPQTQSARLIPVWDKAGTIDFLKPGKGTVVAEFRLDDAVLDAMRSATATGERCLHWFDTDIVDGEGEVVARVRKQLYVRRKRGRAPPDRPGVADS